MIAREGWSLGWALLHFLWQGTAIVAFYALLRRVLAPWLSAQARYLLACATLAVMVVSPALTFAVIPESVPGPVWTVSLAEWQRLLMAVVALWLAGVVFFSIRLAGGWRFTARLRSRSTPASGEWQRTLDRLARAVGIRIPVRLLVSPLVDVPMVIGWLKPAILFPVDFLAGLPAGYVSALLAHELAHIRRHDYLANILQGIAETLLFYHPGVWWVSGQIRAAREQCCDEMAVLAGSDVLVYVKALALLEQRRPRRLTPALAANGGSLVDRIRRLIEPSLIWRDSLPGPAAACAMTLLCCVGIAVATVHAAQKPTPVSRIELSPTVPQVMTPAPELQSRSQGPLSAVAATARRTVLYDPVFTMSLRQDSGVRVPELPESPPLIADVSLRIPDALASIVRPAEIPAAPPSTSGPSTSGLSPDEPAPDEPAPVFRTATQLVQIEVVARRGNSRAAELTKDDFTLLDNGKPQRIALFSAASSKPAAKTATVILIDQRNTGADDQAFVIQRLQRFLAAQRTERPAPLAIYTFVQGGVLRVAQDLTDDDELLKRAARNLRPTSPRDFSAEEKDQGSMEAGDVMEAIARHLAAVPGRKNLIWITAGQPTFNPRMEIAARALTDEGVAFYAVEARGLMASLSGWTPIVNAESPGPQTPFPQPLPITLEDQYLSHMGVISRLVDMTGGMIFSGNNGIEDSIHRAIDDAESGYTLGFYPATGGVAAWHNLKVRISRPGVKLRYREMYFVPGAKPPQNDLILARLLNGPLNATQIRLTAEAAPDPSRPGYCNVHALVDLHDVRLENEQNAWVGSVDFSIRVEGARLARRIAGRVRIPEDKLALALRHGLSLDDSIALGGSTGQLRIVAQDRATGAAGSLRIPLLER